MSAEVPRMDRLAIGVDLGGTKIAAGLFDERGDRLGELTVAPTEALKPAQRTVENLLRTIEEAVHNVPTRRSVEGIGVGSTGPLDPVTGTLLEAETLPNLFYFPLKRAIEDRFHLPVAITNDGNAFALAEALFGAGRGHSIVVGVTIGTGCGCGVVIRGRILEGATANTGEVYRAPLAGKSFDEVLSGRGLEAMFAQIAGRSAPGKEIAELARRGDASAREAFRAFGRTAAQGLGMIAAVLDPSMIVLGGSVASSFEWFSSSLEEALPRYVAPQVAERLRVVAAELGDAAGALGGAALVFSGETIR